MKREKIQRQYTERYTKYIVNIISPLENYLKEVLRDVQHIDRICVRGKSIDSFIFKSLTKNSNGKNKYNDPINQIQDQIGARIVVCYCDDIQTVKKQIDNYFRNIEQHSIVPDSEKEFGYEGYHFILILPNDIVKDEAMKKGLPPFFELQIKTLFQHAWGEAEHDLGYKPDMTLTREQKRKIAYTAAMAWGADTIFNELQKNP